MKGASGEGLIAIVVIIVILGYALMYIAIAAGIGLALLGLFLLFRWLFIGWAKDSKADPLFTKAAKTAVKNKNFVRQDFAEEHTLSDERMKLIISQLRIAGILDGCSVQVEKQWGLHSIFKAINSEEDFFLARIQDETSRVVSSIDDQKKSESNPYLLSILESLRSYVEFGLKLNYLNTKLLAIHDYAEQNEIDEVQNQIKFLSAKGNSLDFFEEDDIMQAFDEFESYIANTTSAKTWNSNHQRIDISQESFCDIQINGLAREVPFMASDGIEAYFYPSFVVIYRRNSETQVLRIVDYQSIGVKISSFTETRSTWFDDKDATIAYRTWLHSRVNGGPDLRYKNNPSTPYFSFYRAAISPIGLDIISGSSSITDNIKKAFNKIKPGFTPRQKKSKEQATAYEEKTGVAKPSNTTYSDLQHVFEEMASVYDSILPDKSLCHVIDTEIHMPQPSGKDVDIPYKVMLVMFIDLLKCYQGMGHLIDFKKRDSYLLPMVTNIKFRKAMTTESEFVDFMELDKVAYIYKNLLLSFETWAKNDGPEFLFCRFAKSENPVVYNKYMILMVSASDYIERANPYNTTQEKKWFDNLSTLLANESIINKQEKSKKHLSDLGVKIANVIRENSIPVDSIQEGTLISILSDHHIFDSVEEKASARILRQSMTEGVLMVVMSKGPTSIEGATAIHDFILTSGFDSAKAKSIIEDVYYSFHPEVE